MAHRFEGVIAKATQTQKEYLRVKDTHPNDNLNIKER